MPKKLKTFDDAPHAPGPRLAIVCSRYNASITDALCVGAIAACESATGETPAIFDAPGSYELPTLCMAAASCGRFDGIVALGCIIKGETSHDEYIASAVADGLVNISIITGIPVAFGVLTTDDVKQAKARAGGSHGNKGAEAVEAVLATLGTLHAIHDAAAKHRPVKGRPDKAAGKAKVSARKIRA